LSLYVWFAINAILGNPYAYLWRLETMTKKVYAATFLVGLLSASLAIAQTKTGNPSTVGVWKLDLTQSKFGSGPPLKSATLTILKDTPDAMAWRWEGVDAAGKPMGFSWSGPLDGSMQDLKDGNGQVVAKASMKREGDVMVRRGDTPGVGTYEARGTLSADGNTLTDVETDKSNDGKTSTDTTVYHRVAGATPAGK
jgi:hypothetical protein